MLLGHNQMVSVACKGASAVLHLPRYITPACRHLPSFRTWTSSNGPIKDFKTYGRAIERDYARIRVDYRKRNDGPMYE